MNKLQTFAIRRTSTVKYTYLKDYMRLVHFDDQYFTNLETYLHTPSQSCKSLRSRVPLSVSATVALIKIFFEPLLSKYGATVVEYDAILRLRFIMD